MSLVDRKRLPKYLMGLTKITGLKVQDGIDTQDATVMFQGCAPLQGMY